MIKIENDCIGYLPGGFFSKLLIVLDWVHNSIYEKEKVYVDWTCRGRLKYNLWDTLFHQPILNNDIDRNITLYHYRFYHNNYVYSDIENIILSYKQYRGKFWNNPKIFTEQNFQNLRDEYNKAWNRITIKNHVNENMNKYLNDFGKKTLGVTVRIPSHYTYNQPEGVPISKRMSPESYYDQIYQEIKYEFDKDDYDKIFVACDVEYFIKLMIDKFGRDKIIFTDYKRVSGLDQDWVEKKLSFDEEYFTILLDVLLLSKCDLIMGGSSNIFLGTLFINNHIQFKIFNILKEVYGC